MVDAGGGRGFLNGRNGVRLLFAFSVATTVVACCPHAFVAGGSMIGDEELDECPTTGVVVDVFVVFSLRLVDLRRVAGNEAKYLAISENSLLLLLDVVGCCC